MQFRQFLFGRPLKTAGALLAALLVFGLGWWFGLPESADASGDKAGTGATWTCSMHPQIRQPNPGLCPICNMDLIPLEGGEAGALREVSVSSEAAALLDLRVTPVVREPALAELQLFGRIDYDERRMTTITSRVAGRLDRLFVDFTGARVRKGDHLAEIYSPNLLVAQRELIEARRAFDSLASGASDALRQTRRRLLDAAREKLRLLDFTDAQITAIEKSRSPSDHLELKAPQSGIVTAKLASEGDYVNTGDPLFKVADLSSVWLELEAYESDLQWLRYAQDVEFKVEALPGRTFHGRIAFIDPEVDPMRRIARVRVNVDNGQGLLKPGMFAEAEVRAATTADGRVLDPSLRGKWVSPMHPEIIKDGPGQCDICGMDLVPAEELGFVPDADAAPEPLLVPVSAVLRTGERAIVYVREKGGESPSFEGREIVLGPRVGERFIVERGLSEGELVVTRGAFKLDSELQIQARPSMMNPNAGLEEKSANSAPEALAGQWTPVRRALFRLVERPDAARLGTLRDLVGGIETSSLADEELERWREFSGRLLNDIEIATRHIDGDPADAVRRVRGAMRELGRYTGLPHEPLAPPLVDPGRAAQLKAMLDAYLPLGEALAADRADAAAEAARGLAEKAATAFPPLAEAARRVAEAEGIEPMREAFQSLSDGLIERIREEGVDAVGNAYVVHCPMAFGNTGADWLSDRPAVENPYFGDRMFRCGSVVEALSVESPEAPPVNPGGGHQDH